ncbi:MAG: YggS family pyridoxal phosphate-dependent enzyme, partial [Pseudomonadota bacterium]
KKQSIEKIRQAYLCGQKSFGENFLQEALDKMQKLADLNIEWHFIGQIQTNKTRKIAENFHWVQSIADLKIARRLDEQRPTGLQPLNICMQVNLDGEANKAGITLADCEQFACELTEFSRLKLRGLMAIPKPHSQFADQLAVFKQLNRAYVTLKQQGFMLDTLSMGMSNDFPAAIAAGANLIRLGTAIFGRR